jgi:glutamine cyclotransferase
MTNEEKKNRENDLARKRAYLKKRGWRYTELGEGWGWTDSDFEEWMSDGNWRLICDAETAYEILLQEEEQARTDAGK